MHIALLLLALVCAWGLRQLWGPLAQSQPQPWLRTLRAYTVPPLLLLVSGVAIVLMGPRGHMVRPWEGWLSFSLMILALAIALGFALQLLWQAGRFFAEVRTYPLQRLGPWTARILDTELPFSAVVGGWQPQLVVSRGLLANLDEEHLTAVLWHEQAHIAHRDTFWFFWLGWLRRWLGWLPHTEALWQELLLLRELRADQWASQHTDPLLLAEALLTVAQSPMLYPEPIAAAFSCAAPRLRLEDRLEALLKLQSARPSTCEANTLATAMDLSSQASSASQAQDWLWFGLVLLPLGLIPFHG